MNNEYDAMEELRKMREKLYGKKTITEPTQKENGTKYKSSYLALWVNKNNKRKRMNKKSISPRAM